MAANLLKGKTALIIGASRGIGAATARIFIREGARVVLASRGVEAMEAIVRELPSGAETRVIGTDLGNPADIERAVAFTAEQFGRLDIAFNNAGITQKRAPFADLADDTFDTLININLRGIFIAMKHQIRAMLQSGGGSIVNTGSIGGIVVMPNMAAYVASKQGLIGLTKTAAVDYARQNIRVNMVAPGAVDTAMMRGGIGATEEGLRMVEAVTPMGRVSTPEEIAEAVLWLSSPAASFVTGAVLTVDGGYTLT